MNNILQNILPINDTVKDYYNILNKINNVKYKKDIINILKNHNVNLVNESGESFLFNTSLRYIMFFIKYTNINVDIYNAHYNNLLYQLDNIYIYKFILQYTNININHQNNNGHTITHLLSNYDILEFVLLHSNVNVNLLDNDNNTILYYQNYENTKLILKYTNTPLYIKNCENKYIIEYEYNIYNEYNIKQIKLIISHDPIAFLINFKNINLTNLNERLRLLLVEQYNKYISDYLLIQINKNIYNFNIYH